MSHETLSNYYQTNFALAQHHKWDIGSLENLIPYERTIYVNLLSNHLEKVKEERQRQASRQR